MKIRKAIEKAKQAREEAKIPGREYMQSAVRTGESALPAYSESRYAPADPAKMIENKCIAFTADSPYLDSFKVLRTRINNLTQGRKCSALMVTSVLPGEGKTLTTINLGLTYAKEFNQTVLLVDCNLRSQDIHKRLGIESDKGLVDFLVRDVPLKDLIIWPGIDKVTLISGGEPILESTELLVSSRMRELVEEVKSRYPDRLVIFDVPPILSGADAIAFAGLMDCIVVVVHYGKTSVHDVKKAIELIPKDRFLGFVVNRNDTYQRNY